MQGKGVLLVISGPSGAGKGTICSAVLANHESMAYSVSATTRAPREGEVNGKSYFFLTKEDFSKKIAAGGFLEYADVFGNFYGTPKDYVLEQLAQGRDVVLEIDVQGALQVKKALPESVLIFILPPSLEELGRRLRGRGTDTEEVIVKRLGCAEQEMSQAEKYDYIVMNDLVADAVARTESIVAAEHLRSSRNSHLVSEVCGKNL